MAPVLPVPAPPLAGASAAAPPAVAVPAVSRPPAQTSEPGATDVEARPVATAPVREPAPPVVPGSRPEPRPKRLVLPEEPALSVTTEPMQRGDLIRPGPGVSSPVPLDLPRYGYPAAAQGSGKRASIRVGILVDEEGKVVAAVLRERDNSSLGFNEAALDAARETRFQPGTRDDIPGRMWTELIFDFAE
jgi:TonB family protein